ncbi:uncharacterized protein LOC111060394 [Nilaparvata lugens]|uniref:uncharacterized protein LOC111060394 n=1 Tax=Nilaparvata lugens TaxID=108931 RepID=UPI00193DDC26|nr:uncharacterized protein LOC111060394 [Nilaparvata lugens]
MPTFKMEKTLFFKKTLSEFLSHLNSHSVASASKFLTIKSQKSFSVEKVSPSKKQRICWKDGTPYFNFGYRQYQCQHGKDMNLSAKKRYCEKKEKEAVMNSSTKRYYVTQTTKKLNCPAHFWVYRVIWMPEYKLSGLLYRKHARKKISDMIMKKLENGESVGEDGFIYNLPSAEEHSNHPVGDRAVVKEPVDSRVRDYIRQLVHKGETNPIVIMKMLETFVESQLNERNRHRRRFYPNLATVRRIVSRQKSKLNNKALNQLINDDNGIDSVMEEIIINEEVIITNGYDFAGELTENGELTTEEFTTEEFTTEELTTKELTTEELTIEELTTEELAAEEVQELPLSGSKRILLMNEFNSIMSSLQSSALNLSDSDLRDCIDGLKTVYKSTLCEVSVGESMRDLAVEPETKSSLTSQSIQQSLILERALDFQRTSNKNAGLHPEESSNSDIEDSLIVVIVK